MKKDEKLTQKEKFIQAAIEHGCEKSEKEFNQELKFLSKRATSSDKRVRQKLKGKKKK